MVRTDMRTERGVRAQASEQDLIARCMDGDLEAFGWLFERYERAIYRYAYRMVGNPDDADDIKQDTFVKAYRALSGFRGECSLLTWLFKIAANLCLDRHKARVRRQEVPLEPEVDCNIPAASGYASDPALLLERKDQYATAQRVLQGMPKHRRELIVLRDLEELSYQQIAEVLNCSVPGVKLRLFRARRNFKERLEALQEASSVL